MCGTSRTTCDTSTTISPFTTPSLKSSKNSSFIIPLLENQPGSYGYRGGTSRRKEVRGESVSQILLISFLYGHDDFSDLYGQDDFSEMLAAFEITLRGAGFRERKTLADNHLKPFLLDQPLNLVELLKIFGVCLEMVGNRKPRRLASLGQTWRGVGNRAEGAANGK